MKWCAIVMIVASVLCECLIVFFQVKPPSAEGLAEAVKLLAILLLRSVSLTSYFAALVFQWLYICFRRKSSSGLYREKIFIVSLIVSVFIAVYFLFFVVAFSFDGRMFLLWPSLMT